MEVLTVLLISSERKSSCSVSLAGYCKGQNPRLTKFFKKRPVTVEIRTGEIFLKKEQSKILAELNKRLKTNSEITCLMTKEVKNNDIDPRFAALIKFAKYTFLVALISFWCVSAYFGVRHLWNSNNFFASPWPLIGLIMSGVLIVVVILPLYISIREDIAKTREKKN